MIFFGILVALFMFSVVVVVHEYGHFKSARFFGVKVEEFGLWIPPRAKKLWKDKSGTLFSLNWLPLWWFVKISWESPLEFSVYDKKWKRLSSEEITTYIEKETELYDKEWVAIPYKEKKILWERITENQASYNLHKKPAWQQSIIILAWVFMNFLLASFVFAILFFVWVKPVGINDTIPIQTELKLIPTLSQAIDTGIIEKDAWVLLYPLENSIALGAWIQEGDLLLQVNKENVETIEEIQNIIASHAATPVTFYIKRGTNCKWGLRNCESTEHLELSLTPSGEWKIGSYLGENLLVNTDFVYKYTIGESIKYWVLETYGHAKLTLQALWLLWWKILFPETETERKDAVDKLSWPIGIVDFISNSLWWGVVFLIIIWAIISVNLWVFNLLPIPALDGWRFIFIVINGIFSTITGRPRIPQHIEGAVHSLFFLLLIFLSFLIAYNDILKIFNK